MLNRLWKPLSDQLERIPLDLHRGHLSADFKPDGSEELYVEKLKHSKMSISVIEHLLTYIESVVHPKDS